MVIDDLVIGVVACLNQNGCAGGDLLEASQIQQQTFGDCRPSIPCVIADSPVAVQGGSLMGCLRWSVFAVAVVATISLSIAPSNHPAGQVIAQEPDVDKLKEKLNELRKHQERLQAEEKRLKAEEKRLQAELQELLESQRDRLLANFTGTLQHDQERKLFKIIMK